MTCDIGGGGVEDEADCLITLNASHAGHHGLEVVAEGHGEATDDQAGVVEKQPPGLPNNRRQASEGKPGDHVADSNQSHQVTSLVLRQTEFRSIVLNIKIVFRFCVFGS